jgi:hypothetical protein
LDGDGYCNYDFVTTATRLQLRNHINDSFPTDPSIGALYGCGTSCPGYLVLTPYPQYTSIPINTNPDGFSRYNSLQVKAQKRYANGLDFILAYSFQKTIAAANTGSLLGNSANPTTLGRNVGRISFVPGASSGATPDRGGAGAEIPDNRILYRALSPDDIPHVLNIAASYELPLGPGKHFLNGGGAAGKIFGGWKLTQNWNAQSGVPMLISAPCYGIGSCRPNLIGDPSQGRSGKSRQQLENQWFNPAALEESALFRNPVF